MRKRQIERQQIDPLEEEIEREKMREKVRCLHLAEKMQNAKTEADCAEVAQAILDFYINDKRLQSLTQIRLPEYTAAYKHKEGFS